MIRSELDVLLDKVQDAALRADLRTQIDRLKQRRSFGLVFEQHIPERVRLPGHPIRVGSQVVSRDDDGSPTFEVRSIGDGVATIEKVREADGSYLQRGEHVVAGQEQAPLDSLVVISDFGEPVLPGFRHLGSVERGGDKPHHVVIKGENHHALEALRFTHAGKVDCIYIDPPYNSGARDWKYNNDYVDENDAYRHSKWLAFMERRLKLAKELLNPADSVLIVTIDEKEVLRLGLLLEQLFTANKRQLLTVVTAPAGQARGREFARVDEYVFVVYVGGAAVSPTRDSMLGTADGGNDDNRVVTWENLLRRGTSARRVDRPNQFYPIFIDEAARRIIDIGTPLDSVDISRDSVQMPIGATAVWPLRSDGTEGRWRVGRDTLLALWRQGYARLGQRISARGTWAVNYLLRSDVARIETGEIAVLAESAEGHAVLARVEGRQGDLLPKTVWHRDAHNAGVHGTGLLRAVVPGRAFPFPKSLYAVEDTIRFFVKEKPDAVILDFFAGSGTTAHALARLNKQDGGRRQCILVTNNEVSVDEAKELRRRGLRPGDPEWEALGIFEHITRPRVTAAITGRTPDGEPIKGDYKFTDEFPMADGFEENVAFLELRYLDADDIDLRLAYDGIAPLLWLRAGAQGPVAQLVDDAGAPLPYVWTDRYGVLFDEDRWRGFVSDRPESASTAFIVTYSPTTFAGIAAELPAGTDTVRLYDTYLSMFLPERGRA